MPKVMETKRSQASGLYSPVKGASEVPSIMRKDSLQARREGFLFESTQKTHDR
jgi:hypothetical protein